MGHVITGWYEISFPVPSPRRIERIPEGKEERSQVGKKRQRNKRPKSDWTVEEEGLIGDRRLGVLGPVLERGK